ncbi:response regulator [Gracilinema caldarium]|uniref:Response regulator receiver protein n=1 Tax=Gracilinema caldarium (strain ATCC 51460 / DSM 7334 / H1) TaxID=744872 RepID=F8EY95_GRAC1|nr:response regulator [Gracilinema caldarium]AEJ18254.1 response regulator receiver protein [Gracilinema caldarium DSM 7334]
MKTSQHKHILIVEDSYVQAAGLQKILEQAGYSIVRAEHGLEALELLQKEHFDLVISDVMMPKMDGYTLCKTIKTNELYKHLPVILVTSLSEPADIIRGIESGADSFIPKPYKADFLLERVEAHLAGKIGDPAGDTHSSFRVSMGGSVYTLNADRAQLFNLLIASYEISLQKAKELEKMYRDLILAQQKIAKLEGILPICGSCKRIKGEDGQWHPVEDYIEVKTKRSVSHGLCPDCAKKVLNT